MKIKKRISVAILNPRGDKTYTSMRMAADYVQRGLAVYEPGKGIRFKNDVQDQSLRRAEIAQRLEDSIIADRGGIIFWDGCKGIANRKSPRNSIPIMGVVGSNAFKSPDDVRFKREKQLVA